MAKRQRKPSVKKESQTFTRQLLSGKLPVNAITSELRKFFGKRGKPLKRELRSRKQIEKFNKLLLEYNRERPTLEKEKQKREAIREKQLATRAKNVAPRRAKAAVAKYEKVLNIMESVKDDLGAYISYSEAEMMYQSNKSVPADKIVQFIKDRYTEMQEKLPDFAKQRNETDILSGAFRDLQNVIKQSGTTDIAKLSELYTLRNTNMSKYRRTIKAMQGKQR